MENKFSKDFLDKINNYQGSKKIKHEVNPLDLLRQQKYLKEREEKRKNEELEKYYNKEKEQTPEEIKEKLKGLPPLPPGVVPVSVTTSEDDSNSKDFYNDLTPAQRLQIDKYKEKEKKKAELQKKAEEYMKELKKKDKFGFPSLASEELTKLLATKDFKKEKK
jgi:hypothetical protein